MAKLTVLQILSSSLWITVLVVRVGCIIEARPSPNNSNGHRVSHDHEQQYEDYQAVELETAASHSFISSPQNGLVDGGESGSISKKQRQLPTSLSQLGVAKQQQQFQENGDEKAVFVSTRESLLETTTVVVEARSKQQQHHETSGNNNRKENNDDRNDNTSEEISNDDEDDDTCSEKADGYYQNLGSGCTSYYFCAAGYQATYVCPIGTKFNGKRCENDYVCPTTTTDGHHIRNDCENKSNGYYPANSQINVGKYFYCFQRAKVIELQCDSGKMFIKDKCVLASSSSASASASVAADKRVSQTGIPVTPSTIAAAAAVMKTSMELGSAETASVDASFSTCSGKSNGFFQDLESHCEKYYYCIAGEKTELRCQDGYVFNGDICVHHSRYECPSAFAKNGDESQQSELKLGAVVDSTEKSRVVNRSNSHTGSGRSRREIATKAGKLPIINREQSPLENNYYSRSIDRSTESTVTMNPSHLNVS